MFAKPENGNGNGKDNGKNHGKAVGQSADFIPPGHRSAPVEVIVKEAPPSPRIEMTPVQPSTSHVLVPGYWTWETSGNLWTRSVWVLPPEPAAAWIQPRFESRTGINVMISGYWRL